MITIRDVQIRLLDIVDYIDDLCKRNKIQYFLVGGSALGAVRHKGFIPWDDDFDIAMTWENYVKFIRACEEQLDEDKFYLQKEMSENWPLIFSKIKMNNTVFKEPDSKEGEHKGIYIDVFCIDNISDNKIISVWQYFCARLLTAQSLAERGYKSASFKKKLAMGLSMILSFNPLKNFFIGQVRKYNSFYTKKVGLLFGRVTYKTAIVSRECFGKAKNFEFENRMLPLPEKAHEFLSLHYGDYLMLPPENERVGHFPTEIKL